jgi:hypothetical protein
VLGCNVVVEDAVIVTVSLGLKVITVLGATVVEGT